MVDVTPGASDRRREAQSCDPTVSAFLVLGEQMDAAASAPANAGPFPADVARTLLRTIEGEIIPRLLLAHRTRPGAPAPAGAPESGLEDGDRAEFLRLVMTDTANSTRRFVDALIARGVSHETLFLDLLTHAARRLGELWEEDRCDFSDVTIGLCRLHEVLREQGTFQDAPGRSAAVDVPRILLATACGDQHVFGVVMVAEFFRRSGWHVWSEPGAKRPQLAALLGDLPFDVLGLSAARTDPVDEIAVEIASLRKASRNRGLRVLVGGRLFAESPSLIAKVGADGAAMDGRTAPEVARRLLAEARVAASV